jgi:hypothetical protein
LPNLLTHDHTTEGVSVVVKIEGGAVLDARRQETRV